MLAFTTDTLKTKPNTVKKFLVAWEKAVNELNAHPEKYQGVLIEQGRVPKSIQDRYTMPPFPGRGVPSEDEVKDVAAWLKAKGSSAAIFRTPMWWTRRSCPSERDT